MIQLLKRMRRREALMALLCAVLVVGQVYFDLRLPDYMTELTKLIKTPGSNTGDILSVGGEMLLCTLCSAVLAVGCGYLSARTAAGFSFSVRRDLFHHVMDAGSEEMQTVSVPSLITRTTNDITQIQMIVAMGLQMLMKAPIMAVWAVIKILGKSWELSAVTAGFVVVICSTVVAVMATCLPRFRLVQKIPGDVESLGNNDIIQMLRDSEGRIWLATFGGGLNLISGYDGEGMPRFRCYDKTAGLAGNICMALTEDRQGDLWVSTHNAVSRFDPRRGIFSNYYLYDNMRNAVFSEATALTAPQGDVLFGSGRHLYRFDPDEVRAAKIDYELRFTGLDVRNKPVAAGRRSPLAESVTEADRIVLPYNFSNFRMEFASLNFAIQHIVGYMYKLEGYDQDWNISGNTNRATYSNVPIGRYTLHVKAFVGNADAAGEGITIGVEVLPPPWLTWWAKTLYVLLALAVAAVGL